MASFFNDDDSTDDEIGVNLQLAERLRINRENGRYAEDTSLEDSKELKQISNMHRKKFAQTRNSSSSSSVEVPSDNPSGPSYDSYHNKKRQNGDKNVEQFGNPKRTCLSDRLRSSPEWRGSKNRASHKLNSKQSKCPDFIQMESGSPTIRSCMRRKRENFANGFANGEDSDFEVLPRITRSSKKVNSVKSCKNKPSGPDQNLEGRPSTSFCLGNSFFESGSDDDSKLCRRNGALRGGKPECANSSRLDRKFSRIVADSEESEEDTHKSVYRCKPLVFSSSDSDGDFCRAKTGKASAVNHSFHPPYENGFDRGCQSVARQPSSRNLRNSSKTNKKAFSSVSSSNTDHPDEYEPQCFSGRIPVQSAPEQPCRAHRSPRINLAAKVPPACLPNQNSAPVRGRRGGASSRSSRRTVSPQLRNHRSQNQHRDCRGRAASARSCHDSASLVAAYPDLFNAEESDNEFFTANSYSDTETSTESLGGVTIDASFPAQSGGTISCSIERDGDTGTDDEIIVLYSAGPYGRNNEARRGGFRNSGRRFTRGSTPHRQLHNVHEVESQSPDPVEQVRQLEEDERMARMLQAEFDAEVDPDFNPTLELDADINDSDTDDDVIDPVGDSDSDDYINQVPALSSGRNPHFIVNHFSNRGANPLFFGLGLGAVSNNRRIGNGRRPFRMTPTDYARLYGLDVPPMSFHTEFDDYETLLSLDDDPMLNRGLHKSDINRLPTRRFVNPNSPSFAAGSSTHNHKRTELNKECQVCLMDYETGDMLRILPCFHEFHTPCIDPWLKINHTCPVCRVRVDLST